MIRTIRRVVVVALLISSSQSRGHAQCQTWDPGFHLPGTLDTVTTALCTDLGAGTRLYVAGSFSAAGPVATSGMAAWDGTSWSSLGSAFGVQALARFSLGSQPALFVGGSFQQIGPIFANYLAAWTGSSWANVSSGMNGPVRALLVFDDGSGPALYAGGSFTIAGGFAVNRIAKWDGSSWSPLGAGLDGPVNSLCAFDDGGGPALFAAGSFTSAGGASASRVAKWNGTNWTALGIGTNGEVNALAVGSDGSGTALFAGGEFTTAGGLLANRVARWNGAFWSPVGSGMNGSVRALLPRTEGSTSYVYAAGFFTAAGSSPASYVARWDGTSWSEFGGGVRGTPLTGSLAWTLASCNTNGSDELVVGGLFVSAGEAGASNVVRWDGSSWHSFPGNGTTGAVRSLRVFDDGQGQLLYAGGDFHTAGTARARGVARWDGLTWESLGGDVLGTVEAIAGFDDGSGPALYLGGTFANAGGTSAANIVRWNGSTWSALGAGVNGSVRELAVFDDGTGPALFVGGSFSTAGGVQSPGLAKWSGSVWQSVGGGTTGTVYALLATTDALGPALYVGGQLSQVGTTSVQNVARWSGSSWSALGSGLGAGVYDLIAFDDGSGNSVYAGGAGIGVSRWNGSSWGSSCGSCNSDLTGSTVRGLASFNAGSASRLHAVGSLSIDLGSPISIARLDPSGWTAVGNDFGAAAVALASFDDGLGHGADLFVGTTNEFFGFVPLADIGKYRGCSLQGIPFCFGDDLDPVVNIPCPCAPPNAVPNPPAAPGHGCANSLNLDGARLDATGTTVPDTLAFRTHVAPLYVGFAFMVKGNAVTPTGIAASDGIRCANGALLRFGGHMAGTNGSPVGQWTYPNTAQTTPVSIVTSQGLGQSAYYQLFYRNSTPNFCDSATANFSNAYQIVW